MTNRYLSKHAGKYALVEESPDPNLQMIVVIPAYAEEDLSGCLDSLRETDLPDGTAVEILIVINHPDSADAKIKRDSRQQWLEIQHYGQQFSTDRLRFVGVLQSLPDRHAGVGLARKTGMDEAVRRFEGRQRDGLIINLDADCRVEKNYFQEISAYFDQRPGVWAAGVYFEHPLTGPQLTAGQRKAIIEYELHLRYFIEAQRAVGLPFAYQTVGSCMVVRSSAYQKMGGMNSRKAGEDFYFLQKFIAIGRFGEITGTTVYPSPRGSFRVPFGTGRAVNSILQGSDQLTYHWESFLQVREMVNLLQSFYQGINRDRWIDDLPEDLARYLCEQNGVVKMQELLRETNRYNTFKNRFFQWFNAFRLMKFLHTARQRFPDQPVVTQAKAFQKMMNSATYIESPEDLLTWYRQRASKEI
jgi:hypothetical protein